MSKFDAQLKKDGVAGAEAVRQIENLKVGDVFEGNLIPALPERVKWKCVNRMNGTGAQKKDYIVTIAGTFCGIPLFTVELTVEGPHISLKLKDKT